MTPSASDKPAQAKNQSDQAAKDAGAKPGEDTATRAAAATAASGGPGAAPAALSGLERVPPSAKSVSPAESAAGSDTGASPLAAASDVSAFPTASAQAANTLQPKIGDESAKHVGEAGEGAEAVGTDTVTSPGKAHGAQLEPAIFARDGSLPHATVATPTGLQPAAAVGDPELAQRAVEAQRKAALAGPRAHKNGRQRLTKEQVERMNPAEVRAVAYDRGYDDVQGGRRSVYSKFLAAQAEDDSLEASDEPTPEPARDTAVDALSARNARQGTRSPGESLGRPATPLEPAQPKQPDSPPAPAPTEPRKA